MRVRGYPAGAPCWVDVASPEPDTAADFYSGLFDWAPHSLDDAYTVFEIRGLAVAGLRGAAPGEPTGWLPYVATDNADTTCALVGEAGGTLLRPPAGVATAARTALVADPTGAVFGLWERFGVPGAQLVNEPGTVSWVEVVGGEPDRVNAFYAKVFGWMDRPGELERGRSYTEFYDHDRVMAGLVPGDGPPRWAVSVLVADCAAAVDRAVAAGAATLAPCTELPIGRFAEIADPFGARLGLVELTPEILDSL
jgi:uncharacterized protein